MDLAQRSPLAYAWELGEGPGASACDASDLLDARLCGSVVPMLHRRAIMICATKQHTGKTSVSMALLSNLREHFGRRGGRVGYMKPVGQEWVEVADAGTRRRADKDAALAHQYFGLTDPISCVSPIVIGRGDTKAFLDGSRPDLSDAAFSSRLHHAYTSIAHANDFVVVEGTGHCGVGAVLGWVRQPKLSACPSDTGVTPITTARISSP